VVKQYELYCECERASYITVHVIPLFKTVACSKVMSYC